MTDADFHWQECHDLLRDVKGVNAFSHMTNFGDSDRWGVEALVTSDAIETLRSRGMVICVARE